MIEELKDKVFRLHSCCQLIVGYNQSVIYDVQRYSPHYIPSDFSEFLTRCKLVKLKSFVINNEFYINYIDEIAENINYLLENDLGFYLEEDETQFFPPFNLDYFPHKIIGNTILDLADTEISFFDKTIEFLTEIEHPNIEIWFNFSENIEFLKYLIKTIRDKDFYSYNLHLNILDKDFEILKIQNLLKTYSKIQNAYYYNTSYEYEKKENHFFVKKPFELYKLQSKISLTKFDINISLFTESQLHHTYFNRKLYIGTNGEIKNAPECEESFGRIQDLKNAEELKEIIATKEFQKYWYVHKEITDVCRDCEFRHMCVDNRLPYERAENEWYHKQECNYNPYIAKWEGEEGYKTLAECGVVSNEKEFRIDHDKIAEINKELWE